MQPKALARLQMFVALWATTFIAAAHLIFYRGAGALWRDEVNSVNMATAPDLFSDLARYQFDSFPIGWFVVLRSWILCFAQWPDFNLRLFGLVVGMLLLGMAWIAARSLGGKTPTVSLVLFALSATTIRFGDSIRAYGLGMLLALATLVTYWRVCQKPGRARVWMAIFCGLLSVHFVFYNAVILFAITVASAALLVAQRRRGAAIALFAGGALAAASLLIYAAPLRAAASWNYVFRHGRGVDWFLGHLSEALNLSGRATTTLWLAAVIASIVVVFALGSRRSWRNSLAIWYCAITIAVALPAYIGFLYILRYPMPPWYFAVAMALTAVCLDGVLTPREEGPRFGRSAAILYVIIGILVSMKPVLFAVSLRQTTVDLAAESVAGQAGAGDLVLVYEWMNGITFQRYYHGQAAWETVPPVSDHTVHRFDLVIAPETSRAMAALNATIRMRIENGGKVWIVTSRHFPLFGEPALPDIPEAPLYYPRFLNQVALPLAAISEPCGAPIEFTQYPTLFENVAVECRRARRRPVLVDDHSPDGTSELRRDSLRE